MVFINLVKYKSISYDRRKKTNMILEMYISLKTCGISIII